MADKPTTDYLAVIFVSCGGGSWGRSPDKHKAIANAVRIYRADWGKIAKIKKGDEVAVNVVDVAPHDTVWWDARGFWVGDVKLDRPIEVVRHII